MDGQASDADAIGILPVQPLWTVLDGGRGMMRVLCWEHATPVALMSQGPLRRAAGERKGTRAKRGGGAVAHESLLTRILNGAHTTSPPRGFARVPSSPPLRGGEDI